MADLHRCGANGHCHSSGTYTQSQREKLCYGVCIAGPGTYRCECIEGYQQLGRSCVEQYKEKEISVSERQWRLCDLIDGIDWTALTEDKQFVFFPGLDSPGGDYLMVGERERAGDVCRQTDHCIAYNTNGILKHSLQAPEHWVAWTEDPRHGLHVLDIDYCQLSLEQCAAHSRCTSAAPGNYSCQCSYPYQASKAGGCVLPSQPLEKVQHMYACTVHLHMIRERV